MRFLILTQYYPPEIGAPQVRLAALARELIRQGHRAEVVTAHPNHPLGRIFPGYANVLYRRESVDGLTIHRTWIYPAVGSGVKRLWNYLSFTLTCVIGLFRAERPDLLLVESPPLFLSIPAFIYGLIRQVPFIFNVADLWPDSARELGVIGDGPALRISLALERWSYAKATYVNAVTTGIERTLLENKRVPKDKILFMPNGVDLELFHPRRYDRKLARDLGLEGKKVVLYSGTLGIAQGLETALDAFELLARRGSDAVLVLVGSGSSRGQLVDYARLKGLSNVVFLDPRPLEEVAGLFAVATAGLVMLKDLPLFDRARPSKIFPILASGKPVIYSGRGEGAALVSEARAGIIVPPGNAPALADAIERLLADGDAAAAMGRSGRVYAESHIGWNCILGQWLRKLETASHDIHR
ncbi:MAG: glycosyltransferase family 4 protein [Candidatus Edwardsbacteria bacterium]|nr:glycosyltransferase family 4 protein [Candidatus Edwardsbacteria bacterium]